MARLPRVSPIGVPQHIIKRGNNHQVCFASEQDFAAYAGWLKDYSSKFEVAIHAWVFMTNHVHLLCTPLNHNAISQMMQGLGRQYVRYFNHSYKRTVTLWEGRYKSCLVQEEEYLLQLYRYIEHNPVRAKMVEDPADYAWSSYQINGLGKESSLCTPHSLYISLGKDEDDRQCAYRDLFKHYVDNKLITNIRDSVNRGMAIGSEQFKREIELLTGRRMQPKKRGRPLGWKKDEV
ncbi:transposase [Psychrobium sp. nBUS_13]|uniref:transposase n=1 Tax=Psychrobium sp. nBUS_13 TaxID=3395319 RepID=UPI003EB9E9F4